MKKTTLLSAPLEIIQLEENSYHIFLNARVNNKRARLLIDTGASKTIFDKTWLEKKVKPVIREHSVQASGINQNVSAIWQAKITSLVFCKTEILKRTFPVLDLSHVNENYRLSGNKPIHGILGCDLLYELRAIVNFQTQKIILQP